MNNQWLDTAGDKLSVAGQALAARAYVFADPKRQGQLRSGLIGLACLWLVIALASLVWNLLPQPPLSATPGKLVNPLQGSAADREISPVDIEQLVGWNLFGTAASKPVVVADKPASDPAQNLEGIESNAKETRLALTLQGIVSSSDPDAAMAVIESKRKQEQYGVGDKLPVSGEVSIAKILADRVVLNNGGRYELLMLFDESSMAAVASMPLEAVSRSEAPAATVDKRDNRELTEMAAAYRQRLYSNPQSLSDVVKIAAVREDGALRGYRISAGKDKQQFESLGFQSNDIVTGVNGIALTDPGKAMELYRVMRSAEEASFNVMRGGEEVTLVVGLQSSGDSP